MRICGSAGSNVYGALVRYIFDPFFACYCAVWPIIHYCRWKGMPIPVLNNYLTDFVFIPMVAHVSLGFTRCIVLNRRNYCYPLYWLLAIAFYVSFIFEVVLPKYSSKAVGDTGDIVAYFLGSAFYCYVHQHAIVNRPKSAHRKNA
ncbi:hypothetical protein CLV42_11327 [Chitinophaga ginsengisoli]|uniref:Magnesium citrate secondary transporter n=1 Tax=Chitinophaga ginsengisoli TaxID=363837 RepID=A0A2P8FUE6_9BACT|nr:hypothetical protein CLV42_11327 [Chitinophaga ginsengisoli]